VLARAQGARGLYWGLGNSELLQAEISARTALKLAPHDPKVLSLSAMALLWCGKTTEAVELAKKAMDISPSYAEGAAYYGDALIHNGRPQEGITAIDRAIALTPNASQLSFYLIVKSEALIQLGEFEEAIAALNKSLHMTENPLQYLYRASAELLLGLREDARNSMSRAFELSPELTAEAFIQIYRSFSSNHAIPNFEQAFQQMPELEAEIRNRS
jgi:tetratricopeptide (TPR) repeat protein